MGFNIGALGGFAGGLATGLSKQQQLAIQQAQATRQQQDWQQDQDATTAAGKSLLQGNAPNTQAQPPMPGQASTPMQQPQQGQPPAAMGGLGNMGQYGQAIAGNESKGQQNPYMAVGQPTHTGDRAFGKYQVMGANIPSWTKDALGQPMTPQQFLGNPQAQDAVFKHKFGQLVQQYGPQGAARAWFAGPGGMNTNRQDVNGMTPQRYGQQFSAGMGQPAPQQGQGQSAPSAGNQNATDPSAQLTQLATKLKAANPSASPAVIFKALSQMAPMMNTAQKQALQEQGLQLRQALAQEHDQISQLLEAGRNNRNVDNNAAKGTREDKSITAKQGMQTQKLDAQGQQSDAKLKLAKDKLDLALKKASDAKDAAGKRQALNEARVAQQNYVALRNAQANIARSGAQPIPADQEGAAEADIQSRLPGAGSASPPASAAAPSPPTAQPSPPSSPQGGVPQPKSQQEYDALPPGSKWMDSKGQMRIKSPSTAPQS